MLAANTDPESPLFGKPFIGVASSEAFETVDHSVPAAAVNAVTDIFPTSWEIDQGRRQGAQPGQHRSPTSPAPTKTSRPGRPRSSASRGVSDDVGDSAGFVGILYLLAVLNVFVGVFNMFPLLPLDGGHAAIATYERVRERDGRALLRRRVEDDAVRDGRDDGADVPVRAGLYLDITEPVG